ncbi:hypothetical protein WJX84_000953 [Apatococcus fuscideae]|uniref:Uncharacterized protein n=1 Tax=Apatococcus fuscideae TaxID=2026836 RepID=A0AAW1STU8_9CHLO
MVIGHECLADHNYHDDCVANLIRDRARLQNYPAVILRCRLSASYQVYARMIERRCQVSTKASKRAKQPGSRARIGALPAGRIPQSNAPQEEVDASSVDIGGRSRPISIQRKERSPKRLRHVQAMTKPAGKAMQTTQEWLSRVCAALTSGLPEWGPELSTSSGILQSPPLDLDWALPRSASMPEPVGKAWQRLVQQIMAEQQAEAASKLNLQLPRDGSLERFLVRLREYQESVRQAIKEGPLSHRSGKQTSHEESENSGDPIDIFNVLDHISAAQEALALSQLARAKAKSKLKGGRGSMMMQKANRVLSMLRTNRESMAGLSSRAESIFTTTASRRASTVTGQMPAGLDANALRQWLAAGDDPQLMVEDQGDGEDASSETSRSEQEQIDDEAMLQKLAGQMRAQGVPESPAATARNTELKPAVEAPYGHGHVSHTPPASLPGSRRASLYDPAAGRHLVQKTGTGEPQGGPRAKYLRGGHEAANLGSPAGSGSVKQRSGNLQRMRSMTTAEDGYEAVYLPEMSTQALEAPPKPHTPGGPFCQAQPTECLPFPSLQELAFIPMPALTKLPEPAAIMGGRTALMQARLQRVWHILELPTRSQLRMAKKWSSPGHPACFVDAISSWEMAVAGLLDRERALGRLLRARQAMNRAGLLQLAVHANALQEAALEFATSAAQQELSAQLLLEEFGDVITYRGNSYPGDDAVSPDQLDKLVKAAFDKANRQHAAAPDAKSSTTAASPTASHSVTASNTARSSTNPSSTARSGTTRA